MKKIEYVALKYYNSCVSEECLYVGMLFNNVTDNKRTFISIKNFKRLASFDDEVNIDFFKEYLRSIKEEVETNIFNYNQEFILQDYIRPFVNELRFTTIKTEITEDPDFIENMSKLFLKFDFDKKERLTKNTEKKYIQGLLRASNVKYSTDSLTGKHNEFINFDFVTEDYAIKVFDFENKDLTRLIASAKTWSYNAREMKAKKKTVFLYDTDVLDSKEFNIIMSILIEDAHKVLPIDRGIDFITA